MSHSSSFDDHTDNGKPLLPHRLRMVLILLAVALFFAVLILSGFLQKQGKKDEVRKANQNQDTLVTVARPHRAKASNTLTLPGEVTPFLQTFIYSRTSGTLKQRFVDIGDHVRTGQLLAIVDVPEIDQELIQAKAAMAQSVASAAEQKTRVDLAKITWNRWQQNADSGGVSQQDVDQRKADYISSQAAYRVSQAVIAQNKANIRRLLALQNYKRITAPFSGVITARTVDAGANIVGGGSSTSTNLFTIEQLDKLRIFINVPQANVDGVKIGLAAEIHLPEQPKTVYYARVTRSAGAVDASSRTMKTEIDLPNANGALSPGRYTQVTLAIPQKQRGLMVSNTVLMIDAKGTCVFRVQPDNTLRVIAVTPGRDNGEEVEILNSDLKESDILVSNPTDTLKNGQKVKILEEPKKEE